MELVLDNKDNMEVTGNNQKNFINSILGKTINTGIDIAIRAILPDVIEDSVIDIKDDILNNGLKEGVKNAIDSGIEIGKSAAGIFTGEFENISQVKTAVDKGGIIETISSLLDSAIDSSKKAGKIDASIAKELKNQKNNIMDSVANNVENTFTDQEKAIEKLEKYNINWKNYYIEKDFDGMQKEYNKMKIQLKNIIPFENTLNETRQIETIHNLIKNKGKNFNLSEDEIELVSKLSKTIKE